MRERETKGTATERFAAQRETVPPRRTERSTLHAPQGPIRLKKLCHWTPVGIGCEVLCMTESYKLIVGVRVRKRWRKLQSRRLPRAAGWGRTSPPARC